MRTGATRVQVEESREHRDAAGNVSQTTGTTRDLGGQKHDPDATVAGGGGINKTIDPNADSGDGSVCRAMPWTCRSAPTKNHAQVNPGNEPSGFAPAPKINPGESIVVNPAMENARAAGPARAIDPAAARRERELINPPGPND